MARTPAIARRERPQLPGLAVAGEPRFTRHALDLMLGEADQQVAADSSARLLVWMCGCTAEERATARYVMRPCAVHAEEFADVPL